MLKTFVNLDRASVVDMPAAVDRRDSTGAMKRAVDEYARSFTLNPT